jgi:hypothetical protein
MPLAQPATDEFSFGVPVQWSRFFDADRGNDFVAVLYNPSGAPVAADVAAELSDALATWNAAPGSVYRARYQGTTSGTSLDGANVVSWGPSSLFGAGTLGFADTLFGEETGNIVKSDVHLNAEVDWSTTEPVPSFGIDLPTVLVHEEGHVAGLGHSSDPTAVMYSNYLSGTDKRTLTADDVAAIDAIYPVTTFAVSGRTLTTNLSFAGTVASFTDPSPLAASAYRVIVDWGDGSSPSAGALTPHPRGGFDIGGVHRFAGAGAHAVAVTVTRPDGTAVFASTRFTVVGPGPTSCIGIVTGATLPGDLEAPAGACQLTNSSVGRDAVVDAGASLVMRGSGIGRDLNVQGASSLVLKGAVVGRDLNLKGMPASPASQPNTVCASTVRRDLKIVDNAAAISIGDTRSCDGGGDTVGRDLIVTGNSGAVLVSNDTIGHDLVCEDNQPPVNSLARTNSVGHAVSGEIAYQVTGGATSFVLSPAIAAFFASHGVTIDAIAPATFDPATATFTTPTVLGSLLPSPLTAKLLSPGGISLKLSSLGLSQTVTLLRVDITPTPAPGAGTLSGTGLTLATFSLAPPATVTATASGLRASGVELDLSTQAAQLLSLATGTTIPPGTPIGTATIIATT